MVQWVRVPTEAAWFAVKVQVRSLAWHSGLRIWPCHNCDIGHSYGSNLTPGLGISVCCWCGHMSIRAAQPRKRCASGPENLLFWKMRKLLTNLCKNSQWIEYGYFLVLALLLRLKDCLDLSTLYSTFDWSVVIGFSSFTIKDDFVTIWNIALATRSSFCFWDGLFLLLGAVLSKRQQKQNAGEVSYCLEKKKHDWISLGEEAGLEFSYCVLSCYHRNLSLSEIIYCIHDLGFSQKYLRRRDIHLGFCPFMWFVLEIFIVLGLGGGEREKVTFSWPSHHHITKALPLKAFALLSCSWLRENQGTCLKVQPLTPNYSRCNCRIH